MPFWDKVQTVKSRYLYLLLIIAILIPLVVPIQQKITPTPLSIAFSDTIGTLKPGDVVVISIDQTPATLNELNGGTVAAITQLKSKGAKIIFWALYFPEGAPIYDTRLAPLMKDEKYGEDYVNFGYIAGRESAAEVLGKNIRSLLKTDAYGKSIDALPIMTNVNGAKDVALLVTVDDGSSTIMWVQQWVVPYKTRLLSILTAGNRPLIEAYIRSNQVAGVLVGTPGVAEYETLLNRPGIGVQQMQSITTTSALILILIAISTFGFLGGRVNKHA